MICENKFCIYYNNHTCMLDTISLDTSGTCADCIHIDLDESILENSRIQMRDKFEKIYRSWEKK